MNHTSHDARMTFDLHQFDVVMGVWVPGVICMAGIVGNVLGLAVLCQDRSHSPTFYSLRALATSDVILLVAAMLQQVIPMYCMRVRTEQTDFFCRNQGYMRVYAWPVICIAQMTSVWMVVFISTERYIAICHPLQAARMRSITKIRKGILCILALSILFNIPKFFEFEPEREVIPGTNLTRVGVGMTSLREDPIYRYLYNTALYCLLMFALPFVTLTVLNSKIVSEMKRARKKWEQLNRNRQREMKATVLPLCIVLVFFVCGTQSLLAFILDAVFVHYYVWLQCYTAVVNVLVIFNSAVNFVLMYLFGQKFRRMLADLVLCRTPSNSSPVQQSAKERFV